MDISTLSTLGSSGVSALTLLQSLSSSSTTSDALSSILDSGSDTVSISSQGQWTARAQEGNPFKADLANLGTLIQSGDLEGAKKAFAAMKAKMKSHQDQDSGKDTLATDFEALGKALAGGDASAAKSAWTTLQTDLDALKTSRQSAASTTASTAASSASSSSNPFKADMDQLGALLDAGDLTGAQTLFKTMASKLQDGPPPPPSGGAAGSSTSSAFSALESALNSNDTTAAKDAWTALQASLSANAATRTTSSSSGVDLEALLLAYRVNGGQFLASTASSSASS